ncbi:hypothetical protein SMICM304S_12042 [Streptomyces microflavus]
METVCGGGVHRLQDRTGGVDPDQVQQGEGAHRQAAAQLHRRVDVLAGGVVRLVHRGGLVQIAEEQPVRDEPGPVTDRDGLLAQLPGQPGDGLDGGRRGQHRGNHLDQLHRGRRVEEVQAEDALGVLRLGREPGHGQGVRPGGEDRGGRDDGVQLPEDLLLDLVRLRHDLDDQLRIGGGLDGVVRTEPGERVGPLLLGDPPAPDGPVEASREVTACRAAASLMSIPMTSRPARARTSRRRCPWCRGRRRQWWRAGCPSRTPG